jgi:opacity protein-like surface antigen
MKKVILSGMVLFLAAAGFAQSKVGETINNTTKAVGNSINKAATDVTTKVKEQAFGVKVGANFSSTNGNLATFTPGADPKMKLGLLMGIYSQFQLSEGLRLQPELLYSAEGNIIDGPLGANNTMVTVLRNKINYINLPLMLQFTKGSGFYFEAGPQIGFRLSAKSKKEEFPGQPSAVTDLKKNTKGTAFSLGAGAGYEMASGLGIGVRYMFGLNDISTTSSSLKSNVLSLSLMYRFKDRD